MDHTDCFSANSLSVVWRLGGGWNRGLMEKNNTGLEMVDSSPVHTVNFVLDMHCKSCHIYIGITGHQVGLNRVGLVPIRLVPLPLVVSRTLVSLPLRTGVG